MTVFRTRTNAVVLSTKPRGQPRGSPWHALCQHMAASQKILPLKTADHHAHWTRSDNPIRGVHSWRHQCCQSRSLSTRCTHLPDTIDMGGQCKNSRHNPHWPCRHAPVSSWHSATRCQTELRKLLSHPAAVSQMRSSRTSCGLSTLIQAFETHRSREALCAYSSSLPKFVPECCPRVRQNQAKGQNTRNVLSRELARHANKVRQNFRSDVPSPTHQNTPSPEVGNTTHHVKHHKVVSWMLPKYQL